MGAISEWHIAIQSEMSEDTWSEIPKHLQEQIKHKKIEVKDAKKVYRKDPEWIELNQIVRKALDLRAEREAKIRIENK